MRHRIPPLELTITTYEEREEEREKILVATVTHTFHADIQKEAFDIMKAHSVTDAFFSASLTPEGKFLWKKGFITLKNSDPRLSWP